MKVLLAARGGRAEPGIPESNLDRGRSGLAADAERGVGKAILEPRGSADGAGVRRSGLSPSFEGWASTARFGMAPVHGVPLPGRAETSTLQWLSPQRALGGLALAV